MAYEVSLSRNVMHVKMTVYLSPRNYTKRGKQTAGKTKLDPVAKQCSQRTEQYINYKAAAR